jgi:multiple sugar transport system substrate-binding protein
MTPEPRLVSRRSLLAAAAALAASAAVSGCSPTASSAPSAGSSGGSAADPSAAADLWKAYSGTTINFISENTSPSAAIAANLAPFQELTGITVNVQQMDLDKVVEKCKLDFSSGTAQNQVIYADPFQILAPMADGLLDLAPYLTDANYPPVEGGIEDFIPTHLLVCGRWLDESKLYALPYDAPTMIWHYRKDLFEKYHDQMAADLGFDPTPSDDITWDQYLQIAEWFNKNGTADVKYGVGCQAKQHDSLQCDFSNVLWGYGGDFFEDGVTVGGLGSTSPGAPALGTQQAIDAATFYKKLVGIAHPSSTSWDWNGLGDAFVAGEVAMCINFHEFAAGEEAAFPGAMGYAQCPKGPVRHGNNYGGCGIGINANATGNELGAAWLFVNWATSPETQLMCLASDVGGGTPTRTSLYSNPEVESEIDKEPSKYPNIRTGHAVLKAWESENIGLRPKVQQWVEIDTVIFTELSKMLTSNGDPAATMASIQSQAEAIMA